VTGSDVIRSIGQTTKKQKKVYMSYRYNLVIRNHGGRAFGGTDIEI